MSDETRMTQSSPANPGKKWISDIQFEVLGNLRTDFTLMTYTNQPSRNHRKSTQGGDRREPGSDDGSSH
jgi:hypothetical protein